MIDIGKILQRAWRILWNYKILWIFGVLLALTGGSSSNGNPYYQFNRNRPNQTFKPETQFSTQGLEEIRLWFRQHVIPIFMHPDKYIATLIWIGAGLLLLMLISAVIAAFIRYTSEAAVLRMVDEYEQTGTKVGFRQGWKLGWTKRAFRMWVNDLVLSLPAIFLVLLLLGLGLLFYFSVRGGYTGWAIGGSIAAIGLTFLFIFAFITLAVFLNLLRQFFTRVAVLEDAGVGESFRRGWAMFLRNWKNAALMWLVMLGVGIGFGIGAMILFFLLIPTYLVTGLAGLIVAAIPGLITFGISSIFTAVPWTWIIAGLVALPFFFMVLFLPMFLVSGWFSIYKSSAWTLTYRELKALEVLTPTDASG